MQSFPARLLLKEKEMEKSKQKHIEAKIEETIKEFNYKFEQLWLYDQHSTEIDLRSGQSVVGSYSSCEETVKAFIRTALSSVWDIAEKVGREEERKKYIEELQK